MADRLNGKVAVVTGAASGMGKAIAMDFLKEGAKVLATDMNEVRLAELIEDCEDEELPVENLVTLVGNITKDEDCKAAIDTCVEKFGTCNVLSHNAGIIDDDTLVDEMTNEMWDKVLNVNLTGTFKMCRAALQYFPDDLLLRLQALFPFRANGRDDRSCLDACHYLASAHSSYGQTAFPADLCPGGA